jgi:endonuclease/exonuclease/phosphatase (EEP) superfamily protein YafD
MRVILLLWAGIAVTLTFVYSIRPDAFSAMTFVPTWAWLVLVLPIIPFLRRKYRWPALVCGIAWIIFVGAHVEELRSVLRGALFPVERQKQANVVRLVSFNCGCGREAALTEIANWAPDIVFLQEAPSRQDVESFTVKLFGSEGACVWDIDTSIMAKGKIKDLRSKTGTPFYSLALLTSQGVGEVVLASVRLWSGNPDINLWNPKCWENHMEIRKQQLKQINSFIHNLDASKPLIVAGDFNVPQGDKVFALLPDNLYDSFSVQGRGIGNTVMNDMPLMRFDQIWVSRDFKIIQSFAVKSSVSDHRMVISDVQISK